MKLLQLNFWKSLFLLFGLTIISFFVDGQPLEPEKINWVEIAFKSILAAPIIETFLFQYLPFKSFYFFNYRYSKYPLTLVLFSSIIFGITHFGSLSRIIFSFLKGIVLINYFIYSYESNTTLKAFWTTAALHGLYNLIIYLILYVGYQYI